MKAIWFIAIGLLLVGLGWAVGSFTYWNANPSVWAREFRLGTILIAMVTYMGVSWGVGLLGSEDFKNEVEAAKQAHERAKK